jgi:hypothetical protein
MAFLNETTMPKPAGDNAGQVGQEWLSMKVNIAALGKN